MYCVVAIPRIAATSCKGLLDVQPESSHRDLDQISQISRRYFLLAFPALHFPQLVLTYQM